MSGIKGVAQQVSPDVRHMTGEPRWLRAAPWISLGIFAVFWLSRWFAFPLVLDPFYHLMVAKEVAAAGGPIAYEWWQYAPVGRPHLYPPILHLLLSGLLQAGIWPITSIRLASVILPLGLLLSLFLVVRRLVGRSAALACLWVALVPFAFHLHSAITLAATLAMIEWLWLCDALERGRALAAGLLMALLFYTHLGLPWIALTAACCCAIVRPRIWRSLGRASWGLLFAVPWWWHVLSHRAFLHSFPRQENTLVELMPLVYLAAAAGLWRCWKMRERHLWFIACWVGLTLLGVRYPYRWLSGEGMMGVVLLGGIGLDWIAQWLSRTLRREHLRAVIGLVLFVVLTCSPTVSRTETGLRGAWMDGSALHLMGYPGATPKEIEAGLYTRVMERVVADVRAHSQPREILWANAPYALGLVAALADRPMSSAMLNEVGPARSLDPVAAAHLIVWFKIEPIPGIPGWADLARYPLARVAEDDAAILYRQSGVTQTARPPERAMPWWVAWGLVSAAVAAVAWDLSRHDAGIPV